MEELILTRPTGEYASQISEYRQEFLDAGDSMDGCGPLRRIEDPKEYLKICREYEDPATVPSHLVPATQFFFIRKTDNKLVGMLQVRHRFNDYLEKYAGHIGYSVRPSERRKGYAKEMLKMALPFCREFGLDKVLITCIDGNIGSEKTILANGGVYESTVHEPNENVNLKRFWISRTVMIQYENLTIRQAEVADAKQLTAWWNNGAVMAHAGFPNGLGTTEEKVIKGLGNGRMVIEESDRLIGECNYRNVSEGVAEIGIKICETDYQNRGVGRKVLSMLIGWLFKNGYSKIILDTNLKNTRAQHVYESLGFCKVRTNIDSWKDQLGRLQSSVNYELVEKDFVSFINNR